MGANGVIRNSHQASITGPTPLFGTTITSLDLRAGATLIIAALVAEGTSRIENINLIDRGYEKIEEKLTALGVKIKRIK
jgi:UDP-N-acetylglucosamine 1-carboxyvinyltransferase